LATAKVPVLERIAVAIAISRKATGRGWQQEYASVTTRILALQALHVKGWTGDDLYRQGK